MKRRWVDKDSRAVGLVKEGSARTGRVSSAHYYQANNFKEPNKEAIGLHQIEVPVLQFHGLAGPAVNKDGLR